jgi:hypothetical protein
MAKFLKRIIEYWTTLCLGRQANLM